MILVKLLTSFLMKLIGKRICLLLFIFFICKIQNLFLHLLRMLDMGFEEDVRYIISQCKVKESRQTAMFSATWPAAIQKLAMEFMVCLCCWKLQSCY